MTGIPVTGEKTYLLKIGMERVGGQTIPCVDLLTAQTMAAQIIASVTDLTARLVGWREVTKGKWWGETYGGWGTEVTAVIIESDTYGPVPAPPPS